MPHARFQLLLRSPCWRTPLPRAAAAAAATGRPSALARYCTAPPGKAPDEAGSEKAPPAEPTTGLANTGADSGPGKGLLAEDDEENLPPLAFEPGVAGAARELAATLEPTRTAGSAALALAARAGGLR